MGSTSFRFYAKTIVTNSLDATIKLHSTVCANTFLLKADKAVHSEKIMLLVGPDLYIINIEMYVDSRLGISNEEFLGL